MKMKERKQKPVSLGGCERIFKECEMPFSLYKNWTWKEIFDFAELIYEKIGVKASECYINIDEIK